MQQLLDAGHAAAAGGVGPPIGRHKKNPKGTPSSPVRVALDEYWLAQRSVEWPDAQARRARRRWRSTDVIVHKARFVKLRR